MHALKRMALLCCGLLALAASSLVAAGEKSSPEAAFRAGTAEWFAAYNAGDVDKIIAMYAEDAVIMPPDAPLASGHAAIREFITKDSATTREAGLRLVDVGSAGTTGASGDVGWHTGAFTVTDADGKTVGTGKYSEIWQKQNGKWAILRDIWNNDAPAAPATPAPAVEAASDKPAE